MAYPHGHHHTHHHGRREEDEYPPPTRPPPPPFFGGNEPPPPNVYHTSHAGPPHHHGRREEEEYPPPSRPPPPPFLGGNEPPPPNVYHTSHMGPFHHHGRREEEEYPPPSRPPPPPFFGGNEPPPPNVYHTSHSGPPPPAISNYSEYGQPYRPPAPPVVDHHPHMPHFPPNADHHPHQEDEFANKPSVRMYSKAETNYSLSIRNGKVILARSDPSDPFQHWFKDVKFSTKVKDEEGFPSFALINKATRQAMKHATGATHPVQLIPYNPNHLDESILWTESKDLGDGYKAIRMVNNIRLNVDAFNGDKNHGGVHDGTTIVLWEWKKGDNQRWKIVPYSCSAR